MRRIMLIAMLAVALPASSYAQEAAEGDRLRTLLKLGQASMSYEDAVAELGRVVRLYDRNNDGVTDDELDVADALEAARKRARAAQALLPMDLDNDLTVSRDEFETAGRLDIGSLISRTFEELDGNRDGVLDWAEMTTSTEKGRISPKQQLRSRSLDIHPTPATPFTLADATTLADALFALADSNHDRLIELGERREALRAVQPTASAESFSNQSKPRSCDLPRPLATDEVVLLGTYDGVAYATTQLGDPSEPTYVVEVAIEPGSKTIYLVAQAYESVIWRFSGATQRVRQVVLNGYQPQAATGVPAQVVAIGRRQDCFPRVDNFDDFKGVAARAAFTSFIGRDEFEAGLAHELYKIAVPSMAMGAKPELGRFVYPVLQVDPATVVSTQPARPYAVLPGRAGLAQLIKSGALQQIDGSSFRIVKPIPHFPADLAGAHSVNFLVAKGIPMPAGSPGHSCVVMEETGEALGICRF